MCETRKWFRNTRCPSSSQRLLVAQSTMVHFYSFLRAQSFCRKVQKNFGMLFLHSNVVHRKESFPDVLKIFSISSSAARQTILDNRMSMHMNYFPYCARSRNCDVSSKSRRQKMSTQRSSVQISSCHKTRWKRNCINHWKAWKFNVSSAVFLAFLFL